MQHRPLIALVHVLLVLAIGCSDRHDDRQSTLPNEEPAPRREVLVSAAASLKEAFTEIGRATESADTTISITFNFGASNLLARQIEQGAPVDLFASAAAEIMDSLSLHGEIIADSRETFATNRLVIVASAEVKDTLSRLDKRSLSGFNRIAVAAPGVPARIYTEQALRAAELWEEIEPRLVYGDNVRQTLDYVARGEAAIGFVYASDAVAMKKKVRIVHSIDPGLHKPITYPVALIAGGPQTEGAKSFLRMLRGSIGRQILRSYGFGAPDSILSR